MSSLADSKAHFKERAAEYGVPDALLQALVGSGFETMGQLAFAVSRPGQETDENRFNNWLQTINGGTAPSLGASAAVKRLHFESEVILTSIMRAAVEQPVSEHGTPKPVPYAEKTLRMDQLKRTLVGIEIEGVHEPAQSLLDETCHQYDTRVLRYIEAAKCLSRENEITNSKVDKKLRLDATSLTIKETKTSPDENTSTAFHVMQCLRRRGLAYEFANLISYTAHERYINRLMRHLSIDAPPGFQSVGLTQIMRADREVFVFCSTNCKDIRPNPAGVRPLDAMLERALADYNTAFHLLPLPGSSSSHTSGGVTRTANHVDPPPTVPHGSQRRPKGRGKSAGKGKSGGKGGANLAPRGFVGCVGRDNRNRPLCFDFNIKGCNKAPVGGTCENGRHACFKSLCFKLRAFFEAHASEMPSNKE